MRKKMVRMMEFSFGKVIKYSELTIDEAKTVFICGQSAGLRFVDVRIELLKT